MYPYFTCLIDMNDTNHLRTVIQTYRKTISDEKLNTLKLYCEYTKKYNSLSVIQEFI
jgi:hypothetical protein